MGNHDPKNSTNEPSAIRIIAADLADSRHAEAIVELLDLYAQDPVGGGQKLSDEVRLGLIPGLARQPGAVVLLAVDRAEFVGIAVCFLGFSTFAARPLLNLHDLTVHPARRGQGIGRLLLAAVEQRARELGCCKVTLEVRADNALARGLYQRCGFSPPGADTLFLAKPLDG